MKEPKDVKVICYGGKHKNTPRTNWIKVVTPGVSILSYGHKTQSRNRAVALKAMGLNDDLTVRKE